MYEIKNQIFLDLSKNQKASLCAYLRAFVKKNQTLSVDEIADKFLEDETYYLEINSSRFPFLEDFIGEEKFLKDMNLFLVECKKYYDYKFSQKPFLDAQKEFNKKQRKKAQEFKMSKEKPTKKQLYYYDKLCKKYDLEKCETEDLSRLDLKNMIERILDEHKRDCENIDLIED
jgi:hypothetical protein